ncbi:17.6 kDa class I heat shock protein 3 [Abeliophyllum distichum]|uniref:17.6 kDa class I heat shock protein 3 n=1 Tax=Abeliophyllum distichum TaxID=126358 RepID=A0ABD1VZK0_9LAMI
MVPLPTQYHLNQLLHLSRLISAYNISIHYVSATVHSCQFVQTFLTRHLNLLPPGLTGRRRRKGHVFKADLPGLKKEEVKVEVEEGNILQISGERNRDKEEKDDTWHRIERSSGKFLRRFRLPENAKMDQIKASMENGVLIVTVPKEEVKKPDVKAIEISG